MISALRSRNFRLLWIGQSASVVGDQLVVVAIALYVTRLTGRPADVAVVLFAYSMPLVAFLLFGGVLADRLPRQRVIVATDLIRGSLHAVLAVLILTHSVRIWHMVVIGVLFATSEAFFRPAYMGLVPQTVEETDIQSAQALGGVSGSVAQFASPALATALVLGVGGGAAFGLDAVTFGISALLVSQVHPRVRGGQPAASESLLIELRQGWRAVRERTWVWATIACFSAALLLALAPFFALGAATSRQVYGSEAVFGITNVFWGLGTVTGVVLGSHWRPRYPMRTGLLLALGWPPAIAVFAAGPPRALTYTVMAVSGVGIGCFGVWWETALAQRIPPALLSRVSAWDWMGSLALLPFGYLLSGWLAGVFSPAAVMLVGGIGGAIAMILASCPDSTRHLLRIEDLSYPPPEPTPVPYREVSK